MSFWDDPANLPPNANLLEGQALEGTITYRMQSGQYGRQLKYVIDGVERWASKSLWKVLAGARIEPGDQVRVTRNPDTPSGGQSWTVERLTQPARTTEVQVQHVTSAGPSW